MFTLSNNGVQGTEVQSKFTFLSFKRENPFMQTLFPPPSMVLFHFLDHTSTKPRDTKFSYFLLQFALLLFTWLHFKMKNLLPLVMSVMHKSPFMTSLAAHFPSSLSCQHLDKERSRRQQQFQTCTVVPLPPSLFFPSAARSKNEYHSNSQMQVVFLQQVGTNLLSGTW